MGSLGGKSGKKRRLERRDVILGVVSRGGERGWLLGVVNRDGNSEIKKDNRRRSNETYQI